MPIPLITPSDADQNPFFSSEPKKEQTVNISKRDGNAYAAIGLGVGVFVVFICMLSIVVYLDIKRRKKQNLLVAGRNTSSTNVNTGPVHESVLLLSGNKNVKSPVNSNQRYNDMVITNDVPLASSNSLDVGLLIHDDTENPPPYEAVPLPPPAYVKN
ncbi:unnamed protein product [Ambrosiozyma monospora]|uniref:Unnamed protein product n=1 Tax=Ambrosiozyma monospora TaxID=43982 RepID=A0ACB5STP9_AMBMO|nr:unnamed protein product [Ambrosiozyma monospora]